MKPSPLSAIAALYDHKPTLPVVDKTQLALPCPRCRLITLLSGFSATLYRLGLHPWRCPGCKRLVSSGLAESQMEGV